MKTIIENVVLLLVVTVLNFVPLKRSLHMFQQNRYEFYRYSEWLKHNVWTILKEVLLYIVMFGLSFFLPELPGFLLRLCTCSLGANILFNKERKKEYVKPLVYTDRVKRQIVVDAVLWLVIAGLLIGFVPQALAAMLMTLLPYPLVYLTALITLPFENAVKKGYENQARHILRDMKDLKIVGITGSYGKTSTKNIIYDLLSEHYYTLKTPASYNTPMGITRTVREELKPVHEVFVCEMGADHVGEISYLMDFVKPHYGIVTSIGPQHLNTFGSLENIIHEKMQEIEMLPEDGVGILNMDNEYIASYPLKNKCKLVRVGIHNQNADIVAKEIQYTRDGSRFVANVYGRDVEYESELLGENNVMNSLLSIALALEMGITVEGTQKYLKEVRPVEHRLQKRIINGRLFIDNAFNSNPISAQQSLDVLATMAGKRILITPGLIDLGKEEFASNKAFGEAMKGKADVVILVGDLEKNALLEGLNQSGFPVEDIYTVSSMQEAFQIVYARFTSADTALIENDLPDAFLK